MNIFENAMRQKLRFPSDRGQLTTEQLWLLDLRLLDTIARAINTELKGVTEESFIQTKPDPRKGALTLQLDILKYIIASKMEDAERAKSAAERSRTRKKLVEALGAKEEEELGKKSKDQLLKELEALDE